MQALRRRQGLPVVADNMSVGMNGTRLDGSIGVLDAVCEL